MTGQVKSERKSKTVVEQVEERVPVTDCRLFRIEGRVQGVWFRESTRREAQPLGITGYAKNQQDGSVEVLACGEGAALDRLAKWLEEGPPMARVDQMGWIKTQTACPKSFETL